MKKVVESLVKETRKKRKFRGRDGGRAVAQAVLKRAKQITIDSLRGYGTGDKHPCRAIELLASRVADDLCEEAFHAIAQGLCTNLDEIIGRATFLQIQES